MNDLKHKGNKLEMVKDVSILGCVNCYFVRWGGKKGKSRRCYKPDNFPMCKAHDREDSTNCIYVKQGDKMKIKTKYKIWHKGKLVPAFCRKPKNHKVLLLTARTIDEIKKGIRYILQEVEND